MVLTVLSFSCLFIHSAFSTNGTLVNGEVVKKDIVS